MSEDVLESFTRQYLADGSSGEVTFIWQGGEPTLIGLDFLRSAVELQTRYAGGRTIRNAIQTNGILLDERWCAFLAEHRFLVGISIDGPPEIHDCYRRTRGGAPTADRVLRSIALMKRAGVAFNTLTVVNRHNVMYPVAVYEFLREIGSGFQQFIPLVERILVRRKGEVLSLAGPPSDPEDSRVPTHVASWSVQPRLYREFLCSIFDRWVSRDVGRVFVQLFDGALRSWCGIGAGLCVFSEQCGDQLVLEHTGDLFSCDHFVYPAYRLGNILETSLGELVHAPAQARFGAAKQEGLPRQCLRCRMRFACNGGCPKHRFVRSVDGEPGLNYLCEAYRGFFAHIEPRMQAMARMLEVGIAPAKIMEGIRQEEARRRFTTAGRNDPCPCGSGRKFKYCCAELSSRP